MNKEELIRNLKYEETKHKNDSVPTFGTNISAMCFDVLNVLENCIEIPKGATIGDMIKAMFPNCEVSIHEYMGIKCGVDVKIYFSENEYFTTWLPSCLWNAPYKKEAEE